MESGVQHLLPWQCYASSKGIQNILLKTIDNECNTVLQKLWNYWTITLFEIEILAFESVKITEHQVHHLSATQYF